MYDLGVRKDVWTCGHKVGVGPVSRIWADLAGAVIVIPAKQVDDVEQGRTTECNVGSGLRKTTRRSASRPAKDGKHWDSRFLLLISLRIAHVVYPVSAMRRRNVGRVDGVDVVGHQLAAINSATGEELEPRFVGCSWWSERAGQSTKGFRRWCSCSCSGGG
jgi:hypothetical protein